MHTRNGDVKNLLEAEAALEEVMQLLESEPSNAPATVPGPDIPALREHLAILVSTDKAKEAIGVQLTYKQVEGLSDEDVEKHCKRYETYGGAKTTETLIERFLMWPRKRLGRLCGLKMVSLCRTSSKMIT